jgi:MFS family permease
VVVFFTPVITKLFSKFHEPARFLMGLLLILAGYGVFLALLGFIPSYYAAILLFTWGEIFVTTAEGPFLSTRIPASHRGRINSFSSVLGSITYSVLNVGVGQLYDHCGAVPAWIPVIGFLLLSILMAVILIRVDRVRYPMLYLPEDPETPEQTN